MAVDPPRPAQQRNLLPALVCMVRYVGFWLGGSEVEEEEASEARFGYVMRSAATDNIGLGACDDR